jgi:Raf kinase inhibitor-like YbhB/YbcL family protein
MKLKSSAFENNGKIPGKYTCDSENINPPLEISDIPENTKSLVLIMDDPDVPKTIRQDGMWVHWVVFNIPPSIKKINENSQPEGTKGAGTSGKLNYSGPCPPDREHRYFFKLYALDTKLNLKEGSAKEQVEKAMKSHVLTEAVLIGKYEREK